MLDTTNATYDNRFREYLKALEKPFIKLCKLEFLQPDNSVAFALDNNYKRGYSERYDSRAFIQNGSLSVSLQNGTRRKVTVTLANIDGAFDYAINKIWFGQRIRLSMGLRLPDGTDFYLPQGVFYIKDGQNAIQPNGRQLSLPLVDKWSYLNGELFGKIDGAYQVKTINVTGNELYSGNLIQGRRSYTDGTFIPDNYSITNDTLLAVSENTEYQINAEFVNNDKRIPKGSIQGVIFYDSSNNFISSISTGNGSSFTFTTPENTSKIYFNLIASSTSETFTVADVKSTSLKRAYHTNAFDAISKILTLSKYDYSNNADSLSQIDNVTPVFTTFYNGKTYRVKKEDGTYENVLMTDVPYDMTSTDNFANILLELNNTFVGMIGYDMTGALRIEPSQEDIEDKDKPILWNFSFDNPALGGFTETAKNSEVYNEIEITSQNTQNTEIWAKAINNDITSDTNVKIIGRHLYVEDRADFWAVGQCKDYAEWLLKRKTILQKSISITSNIQLFHLIENRLITVRRTDKVGSPIEKHLIQSFTIPLSQTGAMTINAVSVNDIKINATIITSDDTQRK